jgi:murein DD-endopeptidase
MRIALIAAASMILAACATTSHKTSHPAAAPAAPPSSPAQTPATPDARELMIDAATSMLGQPYRFGGAEPGGFDCSGLVVYAAARAGIQMPRTASEQMGFGTAIAREEVQAGDLIFMHLSRKELHVAIALDKQLFIHAPSSGGHVRIDSIIAAPYAKGFIAARRVIPSAASALSSTPPQ